MSKRLWCGIYVFSVVLLIGAVVISAVIGMLTSDEILGPGGLGGSISILVLGYLQFIVVHTIVTLMLLFKMWRSLEDGVTPVTAGKAVGFLFIPFFNIYWFFRVWGGYPTEYNKYLDRYRLNAPPIGSGIFVGFAVTVALGAVILIPILILPFVTVFLIARGCDAINNLELARSAAAENRTLSPTDLIGTPENPRSKIPILAFAGAAAVCGLVVLGFGVFAWFNLNPKISAELLPPAVGNFTLAQPGHVNGSFFGGRFETMDNFYVAEMNGARQAIRYNLIQYGSEEAAGKHIASTCAPDATPTTLTGAGGKEVGRMCITSSSVWLQIGRNFLWAHAPFGYDLEKLKAKETPMDAIVAFVKALPIAKDIAFGGQKSPPAQPTTTASSTSGSTVTSASSTADFTLTGKEFYDETNTASAAAKTKYKGKTVQIASRVATVTADSIMLAAGGYNDIFAYFDSGNASSISNLKRDERVVVRCTAEVSYEIGLKHCTLVENKGVISPSDTPDATFTADEYWNSVESFNLPTDAKMKKQNELQGKVIKITGKVKDMAGSKYYMTAGGDKEFPCFPDDENKAMFSSLSEGQTVSFLAVGGSSLSHCVVAAN